MKWFWYSLIGFCIMMCSCKSKEVVSEFKTDSKEMSETAYLNENVRIDTTKTAYSVQMEQIKRIVETIIETEYDTDKNVVKKVTETERTIEQDIKADATEEENQSVTECNRLNANHIVDKHEMVKSETKEESIGGQESFGKWFGLVIGCVIGLFIVYLLKILRVN